MVQYVAKKPNLLLNVILKTKWDRVEFTGWASISCLLYASVDCKGLKDWWRNVCFVFDKLLFSVLISKSLSFFSSKLNYYRYRVLKEWDTRKSLKNRLNLSRVFEFPTTRQYSESSSNDYQNIYLNYKEMILRINKQHIK